MIAFDTDVLTAILLHRQISRFRTLNLVYVNGRARTSAGIILDFRF
jgi:hypothetical protein